MTEKKNENIEQELLGNKVDLEAVYQKAIEEEIKAARQEKRMAKITDLSKVPANKKFSRNAVYKVFNRKQKTETFINGEQAEDMIKYTDDYIIKFDYLLIEE